MIHIVKALTFSVNIVHILREGCYYFFYDQIHYFSLLVLIPIHLYKNLDLINSVVQDTYIYTHTQSILFYSIIYYSNIISLNIYKYVYIHNLRLSTVQTLYILYKWEKVAQSCLTLCDPMAYSPWNYPGQNTGVGSLSLL